jgi:hypothetical protein
MKGQMTDRYPGAGGTRRLGVLAMTLLLVACGGSGSSSSNSSSSSATPSVSPTTVAPSPALRASVLQLTDFPDGWRADPPTNDDQTENSCYGDVVKPISKATSDDYSKDQSTASSTAVIFADEAQVKSLLTKVQDRSVLSCLHDAMEQLMKDNLKTSGEADSIKAMDVALGPVSAKRYGDESVALQAKVSVTLTTGFEFAEYLDIYFVRVGRLGASFQFTNTFTAFDSTLRDQLINGSVTRLRSAS